MKRFSTIPFLVMITLIVSACRANVPSAAPTAATIDLQGTIAAAAFTVVAETQAAIPTSTPIPPTATFTDTPLPTPTFLLPPSTQGTLAAPSNGNSGGTDPCIYKTMPETLQGKPIRIRIDNSTKAKLSVSVNLNQSAPNAQCGYRSYTLDAGQKIVLNNLVEGCYTLWAWNPDPANYFIVTNGTSCLNTSDSWVFNISTNSLSLEP
jgi:hypothetical protein